MRSKFTLFLTLVMALVTSFSFGQEKTITGNVTAANDGLPLPGVSVVVQGTARGVQTDFDGNYSIKASSNESLVFTYLGLKTQTIAIGGRTSINVEMQEDAEVLQEVVVQGYRTATKEKSSIASTTISAETIESRPNANFVQTLSGQVAGLNITTSSGQPGGDSVINLRGVTSINGNTEPLFIIDGAPVNEDNFRSLNPNEIASISVLKDAGATAIYGNRGANGVVIVKTKQGGFGQKLKINYTGILSFSSLQDNDYNLMDSQEQLNLERERNSGRGAGLTDAEIAAATTTDWADFFFDTGLTQNHTLTLSSGSENMTSFTSFGYFDQEGVLQSSGLKRFNIRNNITGKSDNDKFNYGLNLSINYSESLEPNSIGSGAINRNYVLGAYQSVPYISPDDYTNGADLLSPLTFANTPLFLLDRLLTYTRQEDELKLIGSMNASYKITDNLTISSTLSADYESEFLTRAEGPASFNALLFGGGANPTSGFQDQQSRRAFTINSVNSLNYTKAFGKHTIDASVFTEYFKGHLRTFGYRENGLDPKTFSPGDGSGFISDTGANDFFVDTVNANILNAGLFSYFGQLDYDFDTRFGLTGTVRRDASYRFAASNRWATFYSVSGRWNISNESFMDGSIFDVLKLRGSYGTAGNQRISGATIFSSPDFTESFFATGPGYGGQNSLVLSQIGNNTLKWETVTQANVGIDFEIFDRRLRGSVDGYIKETTDLFQNTLVSSVTSQQNLSANTGSLKNSGFDLSLNYDVLRGGNDGLNLEIFTVGNYNKQELADIPNEAGELAGLGRDGGKLREYFTIRYAGVNPANGNVLFYTANGDVTESPDADTDRVWIDKNIYPDYAGSFGLNVDYKGFFVTTTFNYTIGVDRFDNDLAGFQDPSAVGQFRHTRDLDRAWTPTNTVTDIPALGATNINTFGSTRYLRDSDYIRLRFASVGYSFPQEFLDGTGFSNIRIFANAENLVTFTKWRGFDAESINSTSNRYPTPKTLSVGFEFGF